MSRDRLRQPRPLASEPKRVIDSPYLTTTEAAAYLRFRSARALYKAIAGGLDVPVVRRGRTLLFHRDQLDRWLAGESRVRQMSDARSKVGA
jgi:excisionase family DNA binding protein